MAPRMGPAVWGVSKQDKEANPGGRTFTGPTARQQFCRGIRDEPHFYLFARILELNRRQVAIEPMGRHSTSKRSRAALAVVLLLFSQFAWASELCLTTAADLRVASMDDATSPSKGPSRAVQSKSDNDCCGVTWEPTICFVQQETMVVEIPVARASAAGLTMPVAYTAGGLSYRPRLTPVAVASSFLPHPCLSILFCRYLN